MNKDLVYKISVILLSLALGFFIIRAAAYWQLEYGKRSGDSAGAASGGHSFTLQELAQHDGTNGNDCYVAVDGDVYLIEGFALWQMGEHIPSKGRASCGHDLTSVIEESPHGRSKLQLLEKVGTLT